MYLGSRSSSKFWVVTSGDLVVAVLRVGFVRGEPVIKETKPGVLVDGIFVTGINVEVAIVVVDMVVTQSLRKYYLRIKIKYPKTLN